MNVWILHAKRFRLLRQGILLISLPTAIVGAKFQQVYQEARLHCGRENQFEQM